MSSSRNKYTVVILVALFGVSIVSANIGDGGSKCADATCTPAPGGSECDPRYGEQGDGCCPVWHCPNGQTAYGMSKGGSSSFSSFSSSSSGGGMPMGNMFGGGGGGNPFGGGGNMFGGGGSPFGGGGGNPFGGGGFGSSPFGGGSSPFGNMFKNMFGRRRRR